MTLKVVKLAVVEQRSRLYACNEDIVVVIHGGWWDGSTCLSSDLDPIREVIPRFCQSKPRNLVRCNHRDTQ